MIISRTPYRISFFGGGSDYPDWYLQNGGQVISTTIDKYIYISVRYLPPFFKHKLRFVWSKIEYVKDIDQIMHPSFREVLKFLNIREGVEVHYDGDIPSRSGVGSSSSFTVGLLNAMYAYQGKMVSPKKLSEESIHIEQNLIGEIVGSQDQTASAYGGFNKISFQKDGNIIVDPIRIKKERKDILEESIMLFYTGIARTAEEIAASYVKDLKEKQNQIVTIQEMVNQAIEIISNGEILEFGILLDKLWKEKRSLSKDVSNNLIDQIYLKAKSSGAIGGKICGAGGGGFLMLFVERKNKKNVRNALSDLIEVPFKFEPRGSQIIFYE
tara:strand:- start:2150 stop:3127 length:978 start_codon:yes stop_codon:yes gene_type:complete